jgi:hypothetical protein
MFPKLETLFPLILFGVGLLDYKGRPRVSSTFLVRFKSTQKIFRSSFFKHGGFYIAAKTNSL